MTDLAGIEKLANKGDADAQCELGVRCYKGQGVPRDFVRARELFLKAARQGSARAQCNLGVMCFRGEGFPRDYVKAAEWYLKAAAQDYAMARLNLGWMHENGFGMKKDLARAREWYMMAAGQGMAQALDHVKRLDAMPKPAGEDPSGENPSSPGSAPQTPSPQAGPPPAGKGRAWLLPAACVLAFALSLPLWHAGTQCWVGGLYEKGRGVRQDVAQAASWYAKACSNGRQEACVRLEELTQMRRGANPAQSRPSTARQAEMEREARKILKSVLQ